MNDTTSPPVSVEVLGTLQKAFEDFQVRAEKLDRAYRLMQEDFRNLNIELDRKNKELAESLRIQQETQTYLGSILQSMRNGVIGVDPQGMITQFNRAAADITGYAAADVLGHPYEEFFRSRTQPDATLTDVLRSGHESPLNEKVLWCLDGHPVPVSFQTALLHDQEGSALGAVEIFTDVSRIKALEEEMRQARTMAALGEMSATVAHEIRNPLGAMGVWAGLLDRDIPPEDGRKRILGKIIEGLSRLNKIVTNLLVYTRPVRAEFRKVDLREIMNEIADFIQIEIERQGQDVAVVKEWGNDGLLQVMADPEKIQQVTMNLCLNAAQAMPGGGTLTIRVDHTVRERAGFVSFSISDTGCGIEPDKLEKIFDPFYTTRENGTGLGLAIVKKFIEHHSGVIDVASTVGTGTVVRVFLPRA